LPAVRPDTDRLAVQVADGGPELEVTVMSGGAPENPLAATVKLPMSTFSTGSPNVIVHLSGPWFVGLAPARVIETSVGARVSNLPVALSELVLPGSRALDPGAAYDPDPDHEPEDDGEPDDGEVVSADGEVEPAVEPADGEVEPSGGDGDERVEPLCFTILTTGRFPIAYTGLVTGVPDRPLPTRSLTFPAGIVKLSLPLPDPVEALTVYLDPDPDTERGPAPRRPVAFNRKARAVIPETGSEYATFHETEPAFVGDDSSAVTVAFGPDRSTVHEYDVTALVAPRDNASTQNLCPPAENADEYGLEHDANVPESSLHSYPVAPAEPNENVADV
jgi:hypothetical protein